MFAGQRDRIAGLGIAPDACCSEVERETPETTDLDALTMTERLAHHLQQRLHCQVNIIGLQLQLPLGEDVDEFGLGHPCGHSRVK